MKTIRNHGILSVAGLGVFLLINHDPLSQFVQAASPPKLNLQEKAVSPQVKAATSLSPIVKRVSPSVVNIYTTKKVKDMPRMMPFFDDPFFRQFFGDPWGGQGSVPQERREQALGSGVIVSEDGYLLTNNHVVDGADDIKVALADEKTVLEAKIVGTDPHTDIAVIKVEGKKLPAIAITDSDNVEVGDFVMAIGNPFGVGQTVTSGIVSGKGRAGMGIVDYEDFIQTDASINPGNSGGALADAEGRLVGINTAILSRSGGNQGVGFAVPSNLARYVMERLITDGKVTRGYLGVMIQPVTEALAKEFKLKDQAGALVGEVTSKSPAEEAGLKNGDVIVEFNGKKVSDSRHLRLMAAQTAPGTKATVKAIRDGEEHTFTVKLGELPAEGLAKASRGAWRGSSGKGEALKGVEVADLDPHTRRQFDIPSDLRGAVIVSVDADAAAASAGLQPGDVIVEMNRRRVTSADDALEASRQNKGQGVLLRVWRAGGTRYVVIDTSKNT
jgi:serine protease Do